MTKRQYFYLGSTFLLFSVAFLFSILSNKASNASNYLPDIEQNLHERENAVEDILNDKDYILRQITPNGLKVQEDTERLKDYNIRKFTISVFKNDSLAFWTNNTAIPNPIELKEIYDSPQPIFIRHPNGFYALLLKKYNSLGASITVAGLIPIKFKYALNSQHLGNRFSVDNAIPKEIGISSEVSDYPIHSKNGNILCYLDTDIPYIDRGKHKFSFLLLLGCFFLPLCSSSIIFLCK